MEDDEFPRPDITIEKLAKLKPVFRKEGRITPGNSSGVTMARHLWLLAIEKLWKGKKLNRSLR